MLPEERQKLILELLKEHRSVKISDLSERLSVTRETIRKDLYELEEKGLAKKVHGGAILDRTNIEAKYIKRKTINVEEKKAIAKKAAAFVEDGDALYIDLGTTTLSFAQEIKNKSNLTIITNSLPIAMELSQDTNFEVLLPGGKIRNNELSLSGPIASKSVEDLYVDKAFIGVAGISTQSGYTNIHIGEAEFTRIMLKKSQMKIVMADYSKFNVTTMHRIANLSDIDLLITDDKAPNELLSMISETGVKVEVVSPNED